MEHEHPGHLDAHIAGLQSGRPGTSHSHHAHSHGGIGAAEHQLAHRAVEKGGFKFLESIAKRLSSKQLIQKLGGEALAKAGERLGERVGERAGGRAVTERGWHLYHAGRRDRQNVSDLGLTLVVGHVLASMQVNV